LGIQIHGGMGFIEGSGAAQHLRDARIASIYEGTNGIQAIDLVTRKLSLSNGETVGALLAEMSTTLDALKASNHTGFGSSAERLAVALGSLKVATQWIITTLKQNPEEALASATVYQTLFGTTLGGLALVRSALADSAGPENERRIATARFFAEQVATEAPSLEQNITEGALALSASQAVLLAS